MRCATRGQRAHRAQGVLDGNDLASIEDFFRKSDIALIEHVLRTRTSINQRYGSKLEGLLHIAIRIRRFDIAELLINHRRVDVNLLTQGGFAPMHYASKIGNSRIVQLLIGRGAAVNSRALGSGAAPLHCAATKGHYEVARLLIGAGAHVDLQQQDAGNVTPLYYTVRNGHDNVAKLLIDKNADVNLRVLAGTTPLYCAARNRREYIARLLLGTGRISMKAGLACDDWCIAVLRRRGVEIEDYNVNLQTVFATSTTAALGQSVFSLGARLLRRIEELEAEILSEYAKYFRMRLAGGDYGLVTSGRLGEKCFKIAHLTASVALDIGGAGGRSTMLTAEEIVKLKFAALRLGFIKQSIFGTKEAAAERHVAGINQIFAEDISESSREAIKAEANAKVEEEYLKACGAQLQELIEAAGSRQQEMENRTSFWYRWFNHVAKAKIASELEGLRGDSTDVSRKLVAVKTGLEEKKGTVTNHQALSHIRLYRLVIQAEAELLATYKDYCRAKLDNEESNNLRSSDKEEREKEARENFFRCRELLRAKHVCAKALIAAAWRDPDIESMLTPVERVKLKFTVVRLAFMSIYIGNIVETLSNRTDCIGVTELGLARVAAEKWGWGSSLVDEMGEAVLRSIEEEAMTEVNLRGMEGRLEHLESSRDPKNTASVSDYLRGSLVCAEIQLIGLRGATVGKFSSVLAARYIALTPSPVERRDDSRAAHLAEIRRGLGLRAVSSAALGMPEPRAESRAKSFITISLSIVLSIFSLFTHSVDKLGGEQGVQEEHKGRVATSVIGV